ncbi:MAG: hypothetical protein QGD90_04185 [Candidatus Hydrogenedentes bacterium]|nr:hypothetical protein [Candidatus Hydrogenedentota bacterium]
MKTLTILVAVLAATAAFAQPLGMDIHGYHDLYLMKADGSDVTSLTLGSLPEGSPAWSPDGTMLVFKTFRKPLVDNLQHGGIIIHEDGRLEAVLGSGVFPAIRYATKDEQGNVTLREITEEEAREILRQQGDPRFPP